MESKTLRKPQRGVVYVSVKIIFLISVSRFVCDIQIVITGWSREKLLRFDLIFLKVYFLDKNKASGEETQRSLNNQHGEGQAKFICCDVTSKDQLEGWMKAWLSILIKCHTKDLLNNSD